MDRCQFPRKTIAGQELVTGFDGPPLQTPFNFNYFYDLFLLILVVLFILLKDIIWILQDIIDYQQMKNLRYHTQIKWANGQIGIWSLDGLQARHYFTFIRFQFSHRLHGSHPHWKLYINSLFNASTKAVIIVAMLTRDKTIQLNNSQMIND
jgi:hypothetical protein